jgi:putative SOS response-associated peptidase YedK
MCERFQASTSAAELARLFKTTGPLPNLRQRYNASPTQDLAVVLRDRDSGERRLEALRWGLIPSWAKEAKRSYSMINAMAETVASTTAFHDAFKSRRCLVPADGFYEWKTMDGRRPKQPYRFAMTDGTPFAIAGLWARWKEPASGKTVRNFAIITTAPNALCAAVHNRMPVILGAGDHQTWLGEVAASNDELQALLRPFRADLMEAHIIGPGIGNLRRDDATLIERLDFA